MQHFFSFIKWNIGEIIQTFIPSDLKINIKYIFLKYLRQHEQSHIFWFHPSEFPII